MKTGAVGIRMSLPSNIISGVYSRSIPGTYFSDYLLFAVNPSRYYFIQPGIYAALTRNGIEMSIWTMDGKHTIVDTISSIKAGEMFLCEFCWDWSTKFLGEGATFAIFINGVCTASVNAPISGLDSIYGCQFTAFDNEWMDYQNECVIADIFTYDSVPMHLRGGVSSLSKTRFGTGYVSLSRRSDTLVLTDPWSNQVVLRDTGVLSDSRFSMISCDTSGDIYWVSDRGVPGYGWVSMYSVDGGAVTKTLSSSPKCIAVTQIDGMDYPKIYEESIRRCPYVWVADGTDVVLFDHFLVELNRMSGFSDVSCIIPISDGRAWIFDVGSGTATLVSEGLLSIAGEIIVNDPDSGGASIDGRLYIHDKASNRLRLYEGLSQVKSISTGVNDVLRVDVEPNSGSVFVFYVNGLVKWFDWYLRPKGEWSVCPSIFAAGVRRGYRDTASFPSAVNTVVLADAITMKIYEVSYLGVVIRECRIPPGFYSGSISLPAANYGRLSASASVSATVNSGLKVVSGLNVGQYNVDRLSVDLSGGGRNEAEGNGNDILGPTDLPFGVVKGTRLPE
jgi:hypothetical protein